MTLHLAVEGHGHPVALTTTAANGDEREQVLPLLKKTPGTFDQLFMDKGYDADWLRITCAWYLDIMAIIPPRQWPKGKPRQRRRTTPRWKVERTFSWLQRKFRRITTRWERLPAAWSAFLNAALVCYWINILVR